MGASKAVAVAAVALLAAVAAAEEMPEFAARGQALQRWLAKELPLEHAAIFGSHNAYNWIDGTGSEIEVPHNQDYPVLTQITEFGARFVELDVHLIEERNDPTMEQKARLCHTNPETAAEINEICAPSQFLCNRLGIPNYGDDTGCSEDAPAAQPVISGIGEWLADTDDEFLVLYVEDYMGQRPDILDTFLTDAFGDMIFTPAHYAEWQAEADGSTIWPTLGELTESGPRILIMQNTASPLAFNIRDVLESIRANELDELVDLPEDEARGGRVLCGYELSSDAVRVQGDRTTLELLGISLYNGPDEKGVVEPDMVRPLMQCSFWPLVDGLGAELAVASVWTWASTETTGSSEMPCTVVNPETGFWEGDDCEEPRHLACYGPNGWVLSEEPVGVNPFIDVDFDAFCPDGSTWKVPVSAAETRAVALAASEPVFIGYFSTSDPISEDDGPQIEIDGECPVGPVTVRGSGLTPSSSVALLYSASPAGSVVIPTGTACAGTTIDLGNVAYILGVTLGDGTFAFNVPPSSVAAACASFSVQLLDVATCETSDAVPLDD